MIRIRLSLSTTSAAGAIQLQQALLCCLYIKLAGRAQQSAHQLQEQQQQHQQQAPPPVHTAGGDGATLPHQQWQGRETQWMQGNDHQRDRQGQWSTEGLEGAALALVQGDQKDGR